MDNYQPLDCSDDGYEASSESDSESNPPVPIIIPKEPLPEIIPLRTHNKDCTIRNIPPNFMQWGEPGNYIESIKENDNYHCCLPAEIMSPTHFYVHLAKHLNELEDFQAKFQRLVHDSMDLVYSIREAAQPKSLDLLAPGLFVICKHYGLKDQQLEWHRAQIIENPYYKKQRRQMTMADVQGSGIRVRLVDFGTNHHTRVCDVRYMLRAWMTSELPIQAIECTLDFPKSIRDWLNVATKWPDRANEEFFEMMEDQVIGVKFHNWELRRLVKGFEEIKVPKWTVSVDIFENVKTEINKLIQQHGGLPEDEDENKKQLAEFEGMILDKYRGCSEEELQHMILEENKDIMQRFLKWKPLPLPSIREDEEVSDIKKKYGTLMVRFIELYRAKN